MPSQHSQPVILRVITEESQQQETRKSLYDAIEQIIERPLLAYFTSFTQPVKIESSDVDMIEGILQTMDLTKGLAVIISSPGGGWNRVRTNRQSVPTVQQDGRILDHCS